jgi:hypothetical protein
MSDQVSPATAGTGTELWPSALLRICGRSWTSSPSSPSAARRRRSALPLEHWIEKTKSDPVVLEMLRRSARRSSAKRRLGAMPLPLSSAGMAPPRTRLGNPPRLVLLPPGASLPASSIASFSGASARNGMHAGAHLT